MDYFTPISEIIINHKVDNKKIPIELKTIKPVATTVNGKKIRDNEELPQVEKVGIEIGKQIMQGRLAKKLKQTDLAKKLNLTPDFIRDYENGTAPMNKVILNNIVKSLGIRIIY
jgi:putative transcription factor